MRQTSKLIGFIAALLVGGCVEQTLTINSNPSGALVELNGQPWGRTPVTGDFTWFDNYDVTLRADGYQTLKTTRKLSAPWYMWPPLDLVSEMFSPKIHREWAFTLVPAATQPAVAPLVWRAEELRGKLESSEYTRKPSTTTAPAIRGK